MGQIGIEGFGYCTGSTTGTITVNGAFFTTTDPPITYSRSGSTVTVSDGSGEIGTAELSGNLVVTETISPAEGINYAVGQPKAVLTWNEGSYESEDLSGGLSYATSGLQPPGIKVDWGGGDVETLTGSTWEVTEQPIADVIVITVVVSYRDSFGANTERTFIVTKAFGIPTGPTSIARAPYSGTEVVEFLPGVFRVSALFFRSADGSGSVSSLISTGFPVISDAQAVFSVSSSYTSASSDNGFVIVTDTGDTSYRETTTAPIVTATPASYSVTVTDDSGSDNFESEDEPTNFRLDVFDYDTKEISVACDSECPAGTDYQCECGGTLFCYGYDPENPSLFKVLSSSPT